MNHGLQTVMMISHFVFLALLFLQMIDGRISDLLHQGDIGLECHIDPDMCRNVVSLMKIYVV